MSNKTVQVTAEWALWGKEPHDVEYRLLRCSEGTLSADNFEEIITRYSPGNLEELPQAAVAWLRHDRQNYLVMTIHRAPEQSLYDASGRKVLLTYCFCMPFRELAAGPVSFRDMYEVLRREQLPAADRTGIKIHLPVMNTPTPDRSMAMQVACLLLKSTSVCILGADGVDLETRLEFFDSVMALLPYGMRAELSAATWTSSIFDEHKFRLFFSSARREAKDQVLDWDPDLQLFIKHHTNGYLGWISSGTRDKVALLAELTEPAGFQPPQIVQTMARLQELERRMTRYERDEPFESSYATDNTGAARMQVPADELVAKTPTARKRGRWSWRRKRKKGGSRLATKELPARKRVFRKRVAAPSELGFMIAREAQATLSTTKRYDVLAHAVTKRFVVVAIAIIVVAVLVAAVSITLTLK